MPSWVWLGECSVGGQLILAYCREGLVQVDSSILINLYFSALGFRDLDKLIAVFRAYKNSF